MPPELFSPFLAVLPYTIGCGNRPPVADAGPDQLALIRPGTTSKAVLLDGSRSFHPDGRIDRYLWNCGNGFQPVSLTPAVVRCVYFSPGDYLATLTVWDDGTGVIEGGQFQCQK